jgi:hypothetical protein
MKKTLLVITCLLIFMPHAMAAKAKKTSATKASKGTAELKSRIAELEARVNSMTAAAETMKKEIDAGKAQLKVFRPLAYAMSGLVLAILAIFSVKAFMSASGKTGKNESGGAAGREKHFEEICYHVLDDWQNLWFHPENIDMKLFDDLRNHFPQMHADMESWLKLMSDRDGLSVRLGKAASAVFPDVEAMPYVYMLAYEEPDVFIEDKEIKCGPYVCAHVRDGAKGTHELMNSYFEQCRKLAFDPQFKEIKSLNSEIISLKKSIDLAIRKIRFTKEFPGECNYTAKS